MTINMTQLRIKQMLEGQHLTDEETEFLYNEDRKAALQLTSAAIRTDHVDDLREVLDALGLTDMLTDHRRP